jgi:hypothetical protein
LTYRFFELFLLLLLLLEVACFAGVSSFLLVLLATGVFTGKTAPCDFPSSLALADLPRRFFKKDSRCFIGIHLKIFQVEIFFFFYLSGSGLILASKIFGGGLLCFLFFLVGTAGLKKFFLKGMKKYFLRFFFFHFGLNFSRKVF